jgi:hypothetical protein
MKNNWRAISEKSLIEAGFKATSKGVTHNEYIGFIGELNSVRYYICVHQSLENKTWHYQIVTFENGQMEYKLIGLWHTLKFIYEVYRVIRNYKRNNFPTELPKNAGVYSSHISNRPARQAAKQDMESNKYKELAFLNPRSAAQLIPRVEVIPISNLM